MKKILGVLIIATSMIACVSENEPNKEMSAFIDSLMKQMTVEEKIGQLNLPVAGTIVTGEGKSVNVDQRIAGGQIGGLFNVKGAAEIRKYQQIAVEKSRLGIPLIFGMDVIHGYETVFPIPLGLACSFDMNAVEESARIAASEASSDGISWTFSPMVDLSRDPRWGRVSEGNGEDPYLNECIARAMVYGYQGRPGQQYSKDNQIMACVKHFALYGGAEAGRDYNTVDMSHQRMFNEYMTGYKAAADAGAGSFMASFNVVDDVPATVNKWLLTDVLRDQWGWNGFVVTDYTGIYECMAHGVGDFHEVAVKALKAGVDMDMVSESFSSQLKLALDKGEVSIKDIDRSCRRVLEAKYKLGLFKDPYKFCREKQADSLLRCAEFRAAARRISADSYVLLKNEGVLPLKRNGTVAVVGPLAATAENMAGTWSVAARHSECVTLLDGLKAVAGPNVKVLYAKGSNLCSDYALEMRSTMFGRELGRDNRSDDDLLKEAIKVAKRSDVVVAALGESSEMSGESSSRSDISIPDVQKTLLKELLKLGKPLVLVLFDGRPLTIEWESENVPAILNVWFGGSEAGYSIADVLFGDVNPSGKLAMTFPKNVGQIPLYYAHKNTGRPLEGPDGKGKWFIKFRSNYLDVDNDPVYPFGYGLSYTTFEYGPVQLSSDSMSGTGNIKASVEVKNTGKVMGKEVVQMYIQDVKASVSRPLKELKGFEKVSLAPGESRVVSFEISTDALKFWNQQMEYGAESGEFKVFIGGDSTTKNSASFELLIM
ncbi:MAG TPA: beta-glucosidase BglX [Rikenellaceae bacterium]|nr:beta-glucosidase BglX [Rikenellaceae bacterium]